MTKAVIQAVKLIGALAAALLAIAELWHYLDPDFPGNLFAREAVASASPPPRAPEAGKGRSTPEESMRARSGKPCSSPYHRACEGADCSGAILAGDTHRFHLSAIYLDTLDSPCTRQARDLWVCVRASRGSECLSQTEACANGHGEIGAHGTASVPVTGHDLTYGFDVEVREGGPSGAMLGRLRPSYGGRVLVKRPFLCEGGTYKGESLGASPGVTVLKLDYYLEPVDSPPAVSLEGSPRTH